MCNGLSFWRAKRLEPKDEITRILPVPNRIKWNMGASPSGSDTLRHPVPKNNAWNYTSTPLYASMNWYLLSTGKTLRFYNTYNSVPSSYSKTTTLFTFRKSGDALWHTKLFYAYSFCMNAKYGT